MPQEDRASREEIDDLVERVTVPAGVRLIRGGRASGMRDRTACDGLRLLVAAAADLQQDGFEPTDRALHARSGPKPDTTRRLLRSFDLADLPATQTRIAVDARLVPAPHLILAEAHTQRTKGPEKFGTDHPHPPTAFDFMPSTEGARNVTGGIASVMLLAEADGTLLPYGEIQLAQGNFDPNRYPPAYREQFLECLRAMGHVGPLVNDPIHVANEVGARFGAIEALGWMQPLGEPVLCGGRLNMGQPVPGTFGVGSELKFLGCHLEAVEVVHRCGLIPFLELPTNVRSGFSDRTRRETCPWSFRVGRDERSLDELVELLHEHRGPWTVINGDLLGAHGMPGLGARVFRTRATAPSRSQLDITLLATISFAGPLDVYVTTLPAHTEQQHVTLARLALAERARRAPTSTLTVGTRSLLEDGHAQVHKRHGIPERRSFGGVAQAAFGILELARRQAA